MIIEKQKNLISFQLYSKRKNKQPDYLFNVIKKHKLIQKIEGVTHDPIYQQQVKRQQNEKRIRQIKKTHKYLKVSNPEPYVKKKWISPLQIQASQKTNELVYCSWKRNPQFANSNSSDILQAKNVYNILNLNKRMHLFGQFMYCDFDGKQNGKLQKFRLKDRRMDAMHKQYLRLMNSQNKKIVICNKDSQLNKKKFANPLSQDSYYQKIIRNKDTQLSQLLIQALSIQNNFTFSSYIQFYQIFVWQQASKQTQIEFVLKMVMGVLPEIEYNKLSAIIDFMCFKINLSQQKQSLAGFNQVMKKLLFGSQYENCQSQQLLMSRRKFAQSLQMNEQCISIFINIFYSD